MDCECVSSCFFNINQLLGVVVVAYGVRVLFRDVAPLSPKYFEILECVGVH